MSASEPCGGGEAAGGWRPRWDHRQAIELRQIGGRMVDASVQVHQSRLQVEHEGGFEHAAVLDLPARESIRIDGLQCLARDVVPVGQQEDAAVISRADAKVVQREIDPFVEELVVLEVAVDEDDVACPLFEERSRLGTASGRSVCPHQGSWCRADGSRRRTFVVTCSRTSRVVRPARRLFLPPQQRWTSTGAHPCPRGGGGRAAPRLRPGSGPRHWCRHRATPRRCGRRFRTSGRWMDGWRPEGEGSFHASLMVCEQARPWGRASSCAVAVLVDLPRGQAIRVDEVVFDAMVRVVDFFLQPLYFFVPKPQSPNEVGDHQENDEGEGETADDRACLDCIDDGGRHQGTAGSAPQRRCWPPIPPGTRVPTSSAPKRTPPVHRPRNQGS